MSVSEAAQARPALAWWQIFPIFLRLGLTSFGGPIAHLGYFRDEFVVRRKWFDERDYADLVAFCQFLPGPASSQTGIGIGLSISRSIVERHGGRVWATAAPGGGTTFHFTLPVDTTAAEGSDSERG